MLIERRFNGPPTTGNGGYCAGRFAGALQSAMDDAIEVTLRKPPPLEVPLTVTLMDAGATVTDPSGELVAQVRPAALDPAQLVAAVPFVEAVEASERYPGFASHPFPTCFVCGPARAEGDGLRLFPGRLADGRTATPWIAPADVAPELMWAALDCPGGWAVPLEGRPYVLGRLTARVRDLPIPGEHCVVMGAMTGEDGRKANTATTVYASDGRALAHAQGTWVALA